MSEDQIRTRYRCAPAYYMRSKLEKKRSIEGRKATTAEAPAAAEAQAVQEAKVVQEESPQDPPSQDEWFWEGEAAAPEPAEITFPETASLDVDLENLDFDFATLDAEPAGLDNEPASLDVHSVSHDPEPDIPDLVYASLDTAPADLNVEAVIPGIEPMKLDIGLPGFEILDAALSAVDYLDNPPAEQVDADCEPTQQAILEAALEDYSNWPLLSKAELSEDALSEAEPELDLELELQPALESEPISEPESEPEFEHKLQLVLNAEPDLELVLEGNPELEQALASESESDAEPEPDPAPDNVTVADFRSRAPRTVRVVSVVMDPKRPYMVRVVGETTRLAG
jgi:pilus assembly protein FimV